MRPPDTGMSPCSSSGWSSAAVNAVKSELATFADVCPDATIWANVHQGVVEDMVLLGSLERLQTALGRGPE